jgi:hypothetical protein
MYMLAVEFVDSDLTWLTYNPLMAAVPGSYLENGSFLAAIHTGLVFILLAGNTQPSATNYMKCTYMVRGWADGSCSPHPSLSWVPQLEHRPVSLLQACLNSLSDPHGVWGGLYHCEVARRQQTHPPKAPLQDALAH